MKQRIALVSCVKSKKSVSAPAGQLYTSPLFRSLVQYAEAHADQWFILSAEHGLLHPEEVVAPYERTLNRMANAERLAWAERVQRQLLQTLPRRSEIIVLAGERYREHLIPFLEAHGFTVSIPLQGLPFGKQLQRLKELRQPLPRPIDRFYDILNLLARDPDQGRPLATYTGSSKWPKRGVYFFFEPGEFRRGKPGEHRVVRVGTHAVSVGSQSSLWKRLRMHRGGLDGTGNHRGSIFRLHVGEALLRRSEAAQALRTSWGKHRPEEADVRVREAALEQRVSEHIGRMRVLWVAIDDEPGPESMRAFVERNSIALLSNNLDPYDPAGPEWLGSDSGRAEIRASGLWNLNHVKAKVDLSFLDVLEGFVKATIEGGSAALLPGQEQSTAQRDSVGDGGSLAVTGPSVAPLKQPQPAEHATPTRVPYPARSSFLDPIAAALREDANQLSSGERVEVRLKPGGYDGEHLIRIGEDSEEFQTDWVGNDLTRFPARIRAAAGALRANGNRGLFLISHASGVLAITRCAASDGRGHPT